LLRGLEAVPVDRPYRRGEIRPKVDQRPNDRADRGGCDSCVCLLACDQGRKDCTVAGAVPAHARTTGLYCLGDAVNSGR
jgi:hypothetical protein